MICIVLVQGVVARVDLPPPWNIDITALHRVAQRAKGVPIYLAEVSHGRDEIAGYVIFATATLDGELLVLVEMETNPRGETTGAMLKFMPGALAFFPRWFGEPFRLALLVLVSAIDAQVPPVQVLAA